MRATKRGSPPTSTSSFPLTPTAPSIGGVKVAGTGSNAYTPPTPSLPKFSQSVGPGRAPSPQFKKSRPSLPRPESPLRKPQLATPAARPSIGTPQPKGGIRYAASTTPGKFGQSLRGARDAGDPAKKIGYTGKSSLMASVGPRSASALGQNHMNFSDDETTPIGTARSTDNSSLGSVSSFNAKMRPIELRSNEEEIARLRSQLEERDKQLKEQASSLAEMESSLAEVQSLMSGSDAGNRNNRGSLEDKDAVQLRALLREKNEKIAMLTAEFDAHRADFRSTIDTLEMASTETERVYEKRVEDLLQEIREYQDRSEDVDIVARQLKQLEELVQELEEGLEDARRGEAEARGEVEFLRGEVERGRSELRREREKAAAVLNGSGQGINGESTAKEVEQRDDEIRGLKAIIHSLSRDAVPDNQDPQKTPTQRNGSFPRTRRASQQSADERLAREKLEREVAELRAVIETKSNREEELERELERLRRGSATASVPNQRASATTTVSNGTVTHERSSMRDSKGTVVSWRDREVLKSPEQHRRGHTLDTMPESDAYSSATEGSTLWCEICENSGHDILTCTNMFGSKQGAPNGNIDYGIPAILPVPQRIGRDVVREGSKGLSPKTPGGEFAPAPLSPHKKPSPRPSPVPIIPNPMDQGPIAGKESGVVDVNKWCALCERDGHESVDCPFENVL